MTTKKWLSIFRSASRSSGAPAPAARPVPVPADRTCFHITHGKAGSQWMRGILQDLFGGAVVHPEYGSRQIWEKPIRPGGVYACFNLGEREFSVLTLPAEARSFVLIRDLRDTLVSAYFSFRYSHETAVDQIAYYRWLLNRLNTEDGLLFLAETWLQQPAWIQRSWLRGEGNVFRIEDCWQDSGVKLEKIFRECWGLEIPRSALDEAISRRSFAKLSGGRSPGQEDTHSHYRKGVAGDWRQHFTPRLADRIAEKYGDLLVIGGYEPDRKWAEEFAASRSGKGREAPKEAVIAPTHR
jgi:hypothetical protein